MNNRGIAVAGIVLVLGAAAGAALLNAPSAFGGPSLAMLTGRIADPHLLTRSPWFQLGEACRFDSACIARLNGGMFVLAIGTALYLFYRLRPASRLGWLVASLILALAPLSGGNITDALGAEASLSFVLFLVLLGESAGAWSMGPLAGPLIPFLLILQDEFFVFAVLLFVVVILSRNDRRLALFNTATLMLAFCIRGLLGVLRPDQSSEQFINPIAAPVTVALVGAFIFGVLPFLLYGRGRRPAEGGVPRGEWPLVGFGLACIVAGLFAPTGDPALYWFCALASFLSAALVSARANQRSRWTWLACGALIIGCELVFGGRLRETMVNSLISGEASALASEVRTAPARTAFCLSGKDIGTYRLLAEGAFLKVYGKDGDILHVVPDAESCIRQPKPAPFFLAIENGHVLEWEALGRAFLSLRKAEWPLSISQGTAPTQRGAAEASKSIFRNTVDTPVGPQDALTIVAGYSYQHSCDPGWSRRTLTFAAANPLRDYPHADPARFEVVALRRRQEVRLLSGTFYPDRGKAPQWTYYSVKLPRARCEKIRFTVSAPTGRAIATWVTFVDPAVR